jgi:hypothetical protein
LIGLRRLFLLEKIDNEVLIFTDKVIRQAFGFQILPKVLPPLWIKGIQFLEA